MDLSLTLHEPALGACAGNRTLIQLTDPPQNRWTFVNVSFEARGDYQLVFDSSFFNASRGNVLGKSYAHLRHSGVRDASFIGS